MDDIFKEVKAKEAIESMDDSALCFYLNKFSLLMSCKKFAKSVNMYQDMLEAISDGLILHYQGPESDETVTFTLRTMEAEAERRGIEGDFIGCIPRTAGVRFGREKWEWFSIAEIHYDEKRRYQHSMVSFAHASSLLDGNVKLNWYWYDVYGQKHKVKFYYPTRTKNSEVA